MSGLKKIAAVITGISACLVTFSAIAEMPVPYGWYAEGNFGASTSSNSYGSGTSTVNTGTAWNLSGGYKFFPMLGLEVGATSYSFSSLKNTSTSQQFGTDKHWGYDLALKGMLPIMATGFEIFGKLGGSQLYASSSIKTGAVAPAGFTTRRTSHLSPYYGGGVAYYFGKTWGLNAQWMRANGNSSTGRQDMFSGGVTVILY